jgi:hypothetical protein
MLTRKGVALFGYISLGIMTLLLIVLWQRLVPPQWNWALFSVALVLFLIRVTLRLILARQERLRKSVTGRGEGSS